MKRTLFVVILALAPACAFAMEKKSHAQTSQNDFLFLNLHNQKHAAPQRDWEHSNLGKKDWGVSEKERACLKLTGEERSAQLENEINQMLEDCPEKMACDDLGVFTKKSGFKKTIPGQSLKKKSSKLAAGVRRDLGLDIRAVLEEERTFNKVLKPLLVGLQQQMHEDTQDDLPALEEDPIDVLSDLFAQAKIEAFSDN